MCRNNLLLILSVLGCLSLLSGTLNAEAPMSLSEQISNIQNGTNELSNHIEKISLAHAKRFRIVIQNSKIYCIDSDSKEIEYENIQSNAKEYQLFLENSHSKLQRLSSMLTDGLNSGNLVIFYLSEKMYSDASAIVDVWQQSFSGLKNEINLFNDSPLERITFSSDVFIKTNWNDAIKELLLTYLFLFFSFILAYLIYHVCSLFVLLDRKNKNEVQPSNTVSNQDQPSNTDSNQDQPSNTDLNQDQTQTNTTKQLNTASKKHQKQNNKNKSLNTDSNKDQTNTINSNQDSGQNTATDNRISNDTGSMHRYIVASIIFLAISNLLIYWLLDGNFAFVPERKISNCCPEAEKTINSMISDNEYLKSSLENKIASIVEIRKHMLIYEDVAVQKELGDLYENIGAAFQNNNNHISKLYISSRNAVTTFDRLYPLIEREARETGRLAETEPLLKDIKILSDHFQKLVKSSKTMLVKQQDLLPILKKQTFELQTFLHQGHFEIGKFIGYHQEILIDIGGAIQNVRVIINDVIEIADGNKGLGLTIEYLEKALESDQLKAQVTGFISAGVSGSVILIFGKAAFFASLIASPVGLVALGGAGIGGVIGTVRNIDFYNKASNFKRELDILEVERKNVLTLLENYDKSLKSQKEAIEANIKSLGLIKTTIGRFNSKVNTLILPRELLEHIDAEITKIITEYNNLIGFIEIFKDDDTMMIH